jgi:predicted nucleotidyltransferase
MKTTGEYIRLLDSYKRKHADKYGIARMGIFGSVARGEQTESSDVDVYLEPSPHFRTTYNERYDLCMIQRINTGIPLYSLA